MNVNSPTPSAITLADLRRGALCLVLHPHPTLEGHLLDLAAELAAACMASPAEPRLRSGKASFGGARTGGASSGRVLVLDGGNCFNVYPVARTLRRYTHQVNAALAHIRVARAFTCFEMASLVKRSAQHAGPVPAAVLVLDFLSTFGDENVPLSERQRLLGTCLSPLRRLARAAPLLVTARPDGEDANRLGLVPILLQAAGHLLELEAPPQQAGQLALPLDSAEQAPAEQAPLDDGSRNIDTR